MITSYQSSHEAWLPGAHEPSWVHALRAGALQAFQAVGFPDKKVEAWRNTSVNKLARTAYVHDAGALFEALAAPTVGAHGLPGALAEIVIVNGVVAHGLSRTQDLPEGVTVRPLASVLADDDGALAERLDPRTWGPLPDAARAPVPDGILTPDRAFDALNTAFLQDGLVLDVAKGVTVRGTVHVLCVTVGEGAPIVANSRLLLTLGAHAAITVVERHVAAGSEPTFDNGVTDIELGNGAQLTHHLWRLGAGDASHVGHVRAKVGRDARYVSHTAWLGGLLVRNDLDVRFVAPGGEALCTGVVLGRGKAHIDNHTWLRHEAPRCTSREVYKGVYGEQSRGVFNGNVTIAKDAQQTDADLSIRNLLLSDRATVHAKPELEIWADDVKAAHGCTVGQLDPAQLGYLRSRGIDEAQARHLLTEGFVLDVLEEIEDADLRERTTVLIRDALRALLEAV